jgi:hypothetical protein
MLAIAQQKEQQIEDLRPERNRLGAPLELSSFGVEHVVFERVLHAGRPPGSPNGAETSSADDDTAGMLNIAASPAGFERSADDGLSRANNQPKSKPSSRSLQGLVIGDPAA